MGALHDEVRSFCFESPAPAAQRMDFEQLVIEQRVAHGASINGGRLVVRQLFVGREVPSSAHQAKGNDPLAAALGKPMRKKGASPPEAIPISQIGCRQRLGGLLKHYYRQAA